jgi:hypothetical protein
MATAAIAPAIATIHLRSSAFICGSFALPGWIPDQARNDEEGVFIGGSFAFRLKQRQL